MFTVGKTPGEVLYVNSPEEMDNIGYVNQHGLSRKAGLEFALSTD